MERRLEKLELELALQRELVFRMVRQGKFISLSLATMSIALVAIAVAVFK